MKAITQSAASGLNFDNAKSYASATGLLAAGFLVAHNGLKLIKMQDSLIANLGATAVFVAGAMMIENPWIKLALIGAAAYTGVKTLSIGLMHVVAPSASTPDAVKGLSGMIPDSVKEHIAKFLPTFGDITDVSGFPGDGYSGLDEPINGPEDMGNNEVEGMGSAALVM